jgi:hypothetical protein
VHCLIVRGDNGLFVRRWAADTRLNGLAFDEAPLKSGDRLELGSVELELVQELDESECSAIGELVTAEQTMAEFSRLLDVAEAGVEAGAEDELEPRERLTIDFSPAANALATVAPAANASAAQEVVEKEVAAELPSVEASVIAIEQVPSTSEPTWLDEVPASDAAEVVFRELQSACGAARGRSRKLLKSLRAEREQNHEMLTQLAEAAEQLVALRRQASEAYEDRSENRHELRDWEQQVRQLQGQIGTLETLLADHSRQMVELQQELAESRRQLTANLRPSDTSQFARPGALAAWDIASSDRSLEERPAVMAEDSVASPAIDDIESEFSWEPSAAWSSATVSETDEAAPESLPGRPYPESLPAVPAFDSTGSRPAVGNDWDTAPEAEEPPATIGTDTDSDPWESPSARASDWSRTVAEPAPEPEPKRTESAWLESAWGTESVEANGYGVAPQDVYVDAVSAAQTPVKDSLFGSASSEWKSPVIPSLPAVPASIPIETVSERVAADGVSEKHWEQIVQEAAPEATETAKPKPQQASFIERYSHMFADEAVGEPVAESKRGEVAEPTRGEVAEPTRGEVALQPPLSGANVLQAQPRSLGSGSQSTVGAEGDDESIEQYMAKLLKRVRGDSPVVVSSQAPVMEPAPAVEAAVAPVVEVEKQSVKPVPNEAQTEGEIAEAAVNWDALARRAVADSPHTDMGALRALANESARRAISRHQLKKHRRDAVTKVIVSTLAGMTSFWLMLEAPSWKDIQFITACVSLIVAAYWAGEAFRAMFESWRAGHDRLDAAGHGSYAGALPIDVD